MAVADAGRLSPAREHWYNNPRARSVAIQIVLVVVVVGLIGWLTNNTTTNLRERGIASGFGFLGQRAGFDMTTFLSTTSESTYGYMLLAGLVDTIIVSVLAIVIASVLGLIVGIARLSTNWLINLEVYACIVLHSHNAKKCAECLRDVSIATDNLAHIVGMNGERKKYAHFVNGACDYDGCRVINESFDNVIEK